MTRILVDTIETQQDKLQFGDPIGCSYHWLEPDRIDAYGDSVRRLAATVELAVGQDRYYAVAARTFADTRPGDLLLYEDSYRNISLAINRGSAAAILKARAGLELVIVPGGL